MAARWFKVTTDGTVTALPAKPSLQDMQAAVGGYVEHVALDGRTHLWVNEEGKLTDAPVVNTFATAAWHCFFGPSDLVVGDVLFEIWGKTHLNTLLVSALETRSAARVS